MNKAASQKTNPIFRIRILPNGATSGPDDPILLNMFSAASVNNLLAKAMEELAKTPRLPLLNP